MKKVKKWRYYCDYCKKSGASSYHMERHEKRCTKNPDRVCGMCDVAGFDQKPIDVLVTALGTGKHDEDIKRLRDAANGCPACMLAAIRQSDSWERVDFIYEQEKYAFWEHYRKEIHREIP